MNPKRKTTKVVRVSEELLDAVADIAAKYSVAKRDVIDALLEDFLWKDKKDPNLKYRIFQGFASRYNLRKKKPVTKPKPDDGERGGIASVPEWMK